MQNRPAHRNFLRSFLERTVAIFAVLAVVRVGVAQIDQGKLTTSLKGKEVVSRVTLGQEGISLGTSAPLPVNTLAYPDGQIIYRVEFGFVRGVVIQMQKSYPPGTVFQVGSVDFKGDRLELRLIARDRDSARLKLMLAPGWESSMANDQVQKILNQYLVLTQPEVKATVQTPMTRQTESPTKEFYIRKISADPVPGRVPQATVQDAVDALNESLNRSNHDLRQAATQIGLAFHAFEEVHVREQGLTALQDVVTLLQRMGDPPVPHGRQDIQEIQRVYAECLRVAALRSQVDNFGRPTGRAAQFPAYESAFNRGDLSTSQLHSVDELQDASRRSDSLLEIKDTVLNIESGLDTHDYQTALTGYEDLYSKESSLIPAVRAYLAESQPLLGDLKEYVTLTTRNDNLSVTLSDKLHRLDVDLTHLADLSGHPLTKAYLRKDTESRKADIIAEIASIPPIQVEPVTLPFKDGKGKRVQQSTLPELGPRLNEMQAALKAESDVVGLVDQPEIMEFVRSNFSSNVYDSLAEKVKRVEANQLAEVALASEYSKESLQEQQAAEKRRREVDQREELATELVNTAVIITKLEESFQSTHLMGYSIEESKSRRHFRDLVQQNRSGLTSTVKEAIKQHFRQILPGLTVEEASLVRQILSTIDISISAW